MLEVLTDLYNGTSAAVWCKEGVTNYFETEVGLKQGCIMSPLLFCLFVNDMVDTLNGGCVIGNLKIKALLYADDIVLMAPTATSLQLMINDLEKYCQQWNLKVNLTKSKIMVFRNGGKLGKNDKWYFREIESKS